MNYYQQAQRRERAARYVAVCVGTAVGIGLLLGGIAGIATYNSPSPGCNPEDECATNPGPFLFAMVGVISFAICLVFGLIGVALHVGLGNPKDDDQRKPDPAAQ